MKTNRFKKGDLAVYRNKDIVIVLKENISNYSYVNYKEKEKRNIITYLCLFYYGKDTVSEKYLKTV